MLTIRRADKSDLPTVVKFLTGLAEALGYAHDDASRIESGVRTVLDGSDRQSWYWLAEARGVPVGMMRVEVLWDDVRAANVWHLQRMFVDPAHRRSGVATALQAWVRDQAVRSGNVVRLTCHIHAWNKPCQQLKDGLGWFKPLGPIYASELS